jgi:hypothetical protein
MQTKTSSLVPTRKWRQAWIGKPPGKIKKMVPFDQLPDSVKRPDRKMAAANDKDKED